MKPVLQNCWKTSWKVMLRILLPTNAKTRDFLHQNLSMLRVLITGPRQTCFEASDVTTVYGMTPA